MPAADARRRIAQQASDIRWIRAGKTTWPDGSRRKIRMYIPGARYDTAPPAEPPEQQRCVLCGRLWLPYQFSVHPAICTSWLCSSPRARGQRTEVEKLRAKPAHYAGRLHGATGFEAPGWHDAALLAIAGRLARNLSFERPDPTRVFEEGVVMAPQKPEAEFAPAPLTEAFNLLQFTNDLIKDLQDLRAARISVPDARVRAELARQVIRSVHLVVTAQRYLADNAKAVPAIAAEPVASPRRGKRQRDSD
jgi:hypothetical protein